MDQDSSSSRVQMNDEGGGWGAIKYYREDKPPRMVEFVMNHFGNYVTSERQATFVLLIASAIFFVLSIVFIAFTFTDSGDRGAPIPQLYREDISPELRRTLTQDQINQIPSKYDR